MLRYLFLGVLNLVCWVGAHPARDSGCFAWTVHEEAGSPRPNGIATKPKPRSICQAIRPVNRYRQARRASHRGARRRTSPARARLGHRTDPRNRRAFVTQRTTGVRPGDGCGDGTIARRIGRQSARPGTRAGRSSSRCRRERSPRRSFYSVAGACAWLTKNSLAATPRRSSVWRLEANADRSGVDDLHPPARIRDVPGRTTTASGRSSCLRSSIAGRKERTRW